MNNEIAIQNTFDNEQIELIKNTVAKGATDNELKMFCGIAKQYELDPFLKEIWFIKIGGQALIYTSRDGYLKIAQRDENFDGIISFPVREGDIFEVDAENYKVTHKFGTKRGEIIGAWCKVDHKNRKPVICYADFKEYKGTSHIWRQYPSVMIQKVAEVLALKRQFGISGLVTQEEMSHAVEQIEVIPLISDDQAKKIHIIAGYKGIDKEKILRWIEKRFDKKIDSTKELNKLEFEEIMKALMKLPNIDKKNEQYITEEQQLHLVELCTGHQDLLSSTLEKLEIEKLELVKQYDYEKIFQFLGKEMEGLANE